MLLSICLIRIFKSQIIKIRTSRIRARSYLKLCARQARATWRALIRAPHGRTGLQAAH